MAKVAFSKLEAKVCDNICLLSYRNMKNEEIQYEVKYYLPVDKKMEMISKIINQSIDDNGFYNPIRVKIFTVLEVMYAYTNLSFTEKQKENAFKLYDQIVSTGIFQQVKDVIWQEDWKEIEETVISTIDNIYKYKNSIMGILENVSTDYSAVNMDLAAIQEKLTDPSVVGLINDILPLTNAQVV